MTLSITPIYAGLLALLYVLLSMRVIRMRRSIRVPIGDGGDPGLIRRQRVQGNFAEYVPLALVLMTLAELQGRPEYAIHLIGGLLIVGRFVHAFGVSQPSETYSFRVFGMILTFAALITGALTNLGLGSLISGLVTN